MTLHAFDYLSSPKPPEPSPVTVVYGDEAFLFRKSLDKIRAAVLGGGDEFAQRTFDGRDTPLATVLDELATRGLFGGSRRLVVLDQADDFISEHRPKLEAYVTHPRGSGVLVLCATSWPKTTKLAKSLDAKGLVIECKAPPEAKIGSWIGNWSQHTYGRKIDRDAADLLLELIGPDLGLIDQELAKLTTFAGERDRVTSQMVTELVGGWRAKTTFDMLDAALAGNAGEAILQLGRLISSGEEPIKLLGGLGFTLRKIAAAARLIVQSEQTGKRILVSTALEQAGVQPYFRAKVEQQMKRLGRARATHLYRWLLQLDMDLKGESRIAPQTQLEQFLLRLAAPAAAPSAAGRPPA